VIGYVVTKGGGEIVLLKEGIIEVQSSCKGLEIYDERRR
jgi:hypothetical protein